MMSHDAGRARQHRREAKRDAPAAHFRQADGILRASLLGQRLLPCAQGVCRQQEIAVPLYGVPREIEMGINDEHGGCILSKLT